MKLPARKYLAAAGLAAAVSVSAAACTQSQDSGAASEAVQSNQIQGQPDPNQTAGSVVIGNMDPNGVYSPTSSSGTYVMCVNSAGQEYLVYWEGDVLQVNGNAAWDQSLNGGKGGVRVTGAPQMPVCHIGKYHGRPAT